MSLHQRTAARRLMGVSAAAACIALVIAGCSNSPSTSSPPATTAASGAPTSGPTGSPGSSTGTYGFPTVAQDPTAKMTVWVDAHQRAVRGMSGRVPRGTAAVDGSTAAVRNSLASMATGNLSRLTWF